MPQRFTRRHVLSGLAALTALPSGARAEAPLAGDEAGILPGITEDQTAVVQAALDKAAASGRPLLLPAGHIFVADLQFPNHVVVEGSPGATVLIGWAGSRIGKISLATGLSIRGVGFSAGVTGLTGSDVGLLEIEESLDVHLDQCQFTVGSANALVLRSSGATIEDCLFEDFAEAAVFATDSRGLTVRGNRIARCGNGGILVWRSEPGFDGSIVTGNRIDGIDWKAGGNGQNGNGVNVYKAGGVVVSDNVISGCAFSAVRVNAGTNTQIRGNTCLDSGEVAIFSEFGFSGSVIADNIVDGAAQGISITNFDQGGHLATCTGNIVRNIAPASRVNPDTVPVGIAAEADAVISGNVIESVPGIGISAGYGPYLRNVLVSDNVVRDTKVGIAATVAEGAGDATISGNVISGATEHALAGYAWDELRSGDLAADASRFPNLAVSGNRVL